jgi:ketosteroid isomerase-like protein
MKRSFKSAGLAALFVLGAASLPALASEQDWSADQQAIANLLSNGPMGIETDFEAWASEYHDDWTVWFAGQAEPRAKDPHMQLVRDYIDGGARVVSYEAEFADIAVLGDTALARFNATESLMEADGSPRTVRYAGTDYLVRVDGAWKVRATTVAFLPEDGVEE